MSLEEEIYQSLLEAANLEAAVSALSDGDLRIVLGALNRREYEAWPAELVHGVCLVEAASRWTGGTQ